jgi:hypothetical protein
MAGDFEKLAYEEALRALDKQERLLEELRARTGALLAAAALAASFLGPTALLNPSPGILAVAAVAAFVVSLGASLFVLLPKNGLVFAAGGRGIFESFYAIGEDMADVYRHLVYDLQTYWESNDREMLWLSRAFTLASAALVAEVLSLASLVAGRLL